MKIKSLIVPIIVVLLFSALTVASALAAECPTCNGTGKVVCTQCKGTGKIASYEGSEACPTCEGSGVLTPTITNKGTIPWVGDGSVYVKGSFQNEEDVKITANVTAEVQSSSKTYTNSLSNVEFPPHQTIDVTVTIAGISSADYQYFASQRPCPRGRIYVTGAGQVTCPTCGGTGAVSSQTSTCPQCDGTGFVTCADCGGTGIAGEGQNAGTPFSLGSEGVMVGVAVVAAVIIVAVLVVKKKRVTEEQLRRRLPSDFQNWVLQRLSGKGSLGTSSELGIDGYSVEGYPIRVNQSDDVGRNVVTTFVTAMGRNRAKNGIIVAFSFDRTAYEEITRARLHFGPEIKAVTVKELIESKYRTL